MSLSAEGLLIAIIDLCYRVIRVVLHNVLALMYWSRGRAVSPVTDPVLKMSATELSKQIREGKLTSEAVVRAYIKRINEVDPLLHATAERRFHEALREAREVDALVASGSITRQQMATDKPLLGVPFTAKCIFSVKDLPCTGGSLPCKDVRGHEDGSSVALMKEAGAILLANTNMPEMGINLESTNNMYGTTCNPYNTSRTSGGSSGGEGALLGAAGTVVGLGNDLIGSVRIPSMFCGVFAHKPSIGIVPNDGCIILPKRMDLLYTGPMCRYAEDLRTTMKVLTSENTKNVDFQREVNLQELKVFYISSLGHVPFVEEPGKDMQDAVKKVVRHFESKFGLKAQELTIPLLKRINAIWLHALLSSNKDIVRLITMGKADVDELLELLKFVFRQSVYTLGIVILMNIKHIPLLFNPNKVKLYEKLRQELEDQLSHLLDDRSILIMPTLPFPAPYHREIAVMVASACYCGIFNVVGLPVTQCPVGLNDEGLPVGVQVIGKKGNDGLTISCALELEKTFGGWIEPK